MIRLSIVVILFVTVFVMMQSISTILQGEKIEAPPARVKREEPPKAPVIGPVQPRVPVILPDLKPGYLFNAERLLEGEQPKKDEKLIENNELPSYGSLNVQVAMGDILYSGSIIGEKFSLAIISFPAPKKVVKMSRSSRKRGGGKSSKGFEYAQIREGDVIDGFQVTGILPEKIVFKKGEEEIDKFLYDPNKKRSASTSRTMMPRAVPGKLAAPVPQAPALKKAAKPKSAARTSSKRQVVTRKTPEKPDTSRVSRRRRSTGPSLTTPPMPTSVPSIMEK